MTDDTLCTIARRAAEKGNAGYRYLDRRERPGPTCRTTGSSPGRSNSPGRSARAESGRATRSRWSFRPARTSSTRSSGRCSPAASRCPLYPPVRLGRMDEYHERTARMLKIVDAWPGLHRRARSPRAGTVGGGGRPGPGMRDRGRASRCAGRVRRRRPGRSRADIPVFVRHDDRSQAGRPDPPADPVQRPRHHRRDPGRLSAGRSRVVPQRRDVAADVLRHGPDRLRDGRDRPARGSDADPAGAVRRAFRRSGCGRSRRIAARSARRRTSPTAYASNESRTRTWRGSTCRVGAWP